MAASLASAASLDSSVIVPWTEIADAGLGRQRASSNYRYGEAVGENPRYNRSGGHLDVGYDGNQVAAVATDSARYRTLDGVGVGVISRWGRVTGRSTTPASTG